MRKLINNKWFSLSMTLLTFAAVIAAIAIPEIAVTLASVFGLGAAGLGGVTLGATVTGPINVKTTEGSSSTHFERSVSDIITFQKPAATPLDTLVRKIAKKEKVKHFKAEWEEVGVRGAEDTLTDLFTAAGSSADESVTLSVTNTEIWSVDDTGWAPGYSGGDGEDIRFHVTAVDEDNDTITVSAINGTNSSGAGKRMPSLENGTKLYRLGPAKSELDASHTVKYQVPVFDYNYCQTFQCQLEEGVLEAQHRAESGYNFNDKKMLALYDYRTRMEQTHLFGNRRKQTRGSKDYYYAGGIIPKISNSIEYGPGSGSTAITADDIIDICETVFAPNNGSEERYLFAGRTLVSAIDKIDTDKRRIEATETEIIVGMKVKTLVSSHGILHIVPHRGLDVVNGNGVNWREKGVIVDMQHLIKEVLEEPTVTPLDLNRTAQRKVKNAMRIDETSCLSLRYAGSGGVHAIIEPQQST